MAVYLSPVGGVAAQFFTNTGSVLTGGKLYSYAAGTTTPLPTYTSNSGGTANTNPIILDSAGRVPNSGEIWLADNTQYKFALYDATNVLIATWDNINGINSNFTNYIANQEIQTATAGQTVFTLANPYVPGAGTLSVFVDGVNQYGPSASYAYVETNANTVTFTNGLHVGASVKFTTVQTLTTTQSTTAALVSYNEGGTGAVTTTVQAKLQQIVSVKDFGATGNGTTDDTAAIQTAINSGSVLFFPAGTYRITSTLTISQTGSTVFNGVGLPSFSSGSKLVFDHTLDSTPFIDIEGDQYTGGFEFNGLWFYGSGRNGTYNTSPNNLIQIGPNTGAADRDVQFRNCKFENSGYGIVIWGRGLTVEDCQFVTLDYPIYLDFPSSFIPGGTSDTNLVNGFRSIYIRNNRVHSCKVAFIYNVGYNASNLYGLLVTGNYIDSNCGLFRGSGNNLTFTGNTVINLSYAAFDFPTSVNNVTINGNTFAGLNNGTSINATSIVAGQKYYILSVGSTNFTSIGATSNTQYQVFTATGVGTGSGTVIPVYMDTDESVITMEGGGTYSNIIFNGNAVSNIYKNAIILNGTWSEITIANNSFTNVLMANGDPSLSVNYAIAYTLSGGTGLNFVNNIVQTNPYARNLAVVNLAAITPSSLTGWTIRNTIFPTASLIEHNFNSLYDLNQDVYTLLYTGDGTTKTINLVATPKAVMVVCRTGANAGKVFGNATGTSSGVGVYIGSQSVVVSGTANATGDTYSLITWK